MSLKFNPLLFGGLQKEGGGVSKEEVETLLELYVKLAGRKNTQKIIGGTEAGGTLDLEAEPGAYSKIELTGTEAKFEELIVQVGEIIGLAALTATGTVAAGSLNATNAQFDNLTTTVGPNILAGRLALEALSPATIETTPQNNYAPGAGTVIRVGANKPVVISGLKKVSESTVPENEQVLLFINVGTEPIIFANESVALKGVIKKATITAHEAKTTVKSFKLKEVSSYVGLAVGNEIEGSGINKGTLIEKMSAGEEAAKELTMTKEAAGTNAKQSYNFLEGGREITGLPSTKELYIGQTVRGTGVPLTPEPTIETIISETAVKLTRNTTKEEETNLTFISGSAGENHIRFSTGLNFELKANEAIMLYYDRVIKRYRGLWISTPPGTITPIAGAEGVTTVGSPGYPRKVTLAFKGNGSTEKVTCKHNLENRAVQIQVQIESGGLPGEVVEVAKKAAISASEVEVTFSSAPAKGLVYFITVVA
jgi:hypothetical protein